MKKKTIFMSITLSNHQIMRSVGPNISLLLTYSNGNLFFLHILSYCLKKEI